jgi:hypothetical protein
MKKTAVGLTILLIPISLFSQNIYFDRFSFLLSPKILKDGSITEFSVGYKYTELFSGKLLMRFSKETKNESFDETVEDSLNAINDNVFEAFLTPIEYFFIRNTVSELWVGAGIYYNYQSKYEFGYFNIPELELLGKEKVNSFSNDFSMHILGPDIKIGFNYRKNWFNLSAYGGIVPIFYLSSRQKMTIVPLLEPDYANFSQQTNGSPYVYADMGLIFFKYVSLNILYDFSRLNYKVIDFDNDFKWYNPDRTVISQSLKFEASFLVPMGGSIYTRIGYGHTFDSLRPDSSPPVVSSRQYIIFSSQTAR